MRSLWTGVVSFGMVSVPVRLYRGTDDRAPGLRLLCPCHEQPVAQPRRCSVNGRSLETQELRRGALRDGRYVVLTDSDLAALPLRSAHTIELDAFVPRADVPLATHASGVYYLEPADAKKLGSDRPYALLRAALAESGTFGIGRVALREREHLCALSTTGNVITLTMLCWPDALRDVSALNLPDSGTIEQPELSLALQLVAALKSSWDPARYRDAFGPALDRLIDEKAAGGA